MLSATVELAAGQSANTNSGPFNFVVTFSKTLGAAFTSSAIGFNNGITGSALGTGAAVQVTVNEVTPLRVYSVQITGATQPNGTVSLMIPAGADRKSTRLNSSHT